MGVKDVGDRSFVPWDSKRHSERNKKNLEVGLDIDVMLTSGGLTLMHCTESPSLPSCTPCCSGIFKE